MRRNWTYEYPLLILAAGALVPSVYLTAGLRAMWHDPVKRLGATLAIGLALILLFAAYLFVPEQVLARYIGVLFLILAAVGLASVGRRRAYLTVLAAALLLFGGIRAIALSLAPDARVRSYFGVYTISSDGRKRVFTSGTTVHGVQLIGNATRERTPTTYYAQGSGVGDAMTAAPALYGDHARIGVVGLGAGTLACYALPGQAWRFYEIDPAVVRIARDTGQFRYLARCLPQATIVLGDARLSLAATPSATFDILALDAFSSDAIPMHLLTQEAFATYGRVLDTRGLLLVHISNRFLDLEPVVAAAADAGDWYALELNYRPSTLQEGASRSAWIALSRDRDTLAKLRARDPAWAPLKRRAGFTPWSDDYSTILPLLKGF